MESKARATDALGRQPNILAVEDDPTTAIFLKSVLQSFGFRLDVATDGQHGIEKWRSGAYDLILMDMQMPQMDGVSATRVIREEEAAHGRHTPIIGMTGSSFEDDHAKCQAAGMDVCLVKPINLAEAAEVINALLRKG